VGRFDDGMPSPRAIAHYFRIFRRYAGARLYLVFALSLLAVTTESLGIALLLPLVLLLDTGSAPGGEGGGGVPMAGGDQMSGLEGLLHGVLSFFGVHDSIPGILVFMSLVFLLKGGIKFAEGAYMQHLTAQLMRDVRTSLFGAYSSMDYGHYAKNSTGHFINLVNTQVSGLVRSFEKYAVFLGTVITVATYFAFAFLISWTFAAMALAAGALVLFLFRRLNGYVRRLSVQTASEYGRMNHFIVQSLQAFKYLTSTGHVRPLRRAVERSIRTLSSYQRRLGIADSFTTAVKEPVGVAVLVLLILIQLVVLNEPLAPIVVSLVLIHRAMGNVVAVQSKWQSFMSRVGSLDAVEDEFDQVRQNQETSGPEILKPLSREIELDRVSFAYDPSDGNVLEDITLTIPANRTIALVGESGAGKSTLVDLLTLLLRPGTGELRVDGVPHHRIELFSWRRQIGYVSQETVIFDDTVANNICLWRGEYDEDSDVRRQVRQAAKRACALEFIEALPEGFNTRIGDRGIRLSAGQRQRLFIARELYKNPSLLILDEATSALDSESEQTIKESIDELHGSTTVVIIAHRLSTIRDVDRIYVLEEGRIREEGSYEELVSRTGGLFQRSVSLQSLGRVEEAAP
jgi:ABC-type multidrug transport system fused ATPase/permease subunit